MQIATMIVCYLGCILPLSTKDLQITASSGIPGDGASFFFFPGSFQVCPGNVKENITKKNYDRYIEIDLLNLTKITGIATRRREYVYHYKISYRRDGGIWNFYQGKNQTVKVNFIDILNWYVHVHASSEPNLVRRVSTYAQRFKSCLYNDLNLNYKFVQVPIK